MNMLRFYNSIPIVTRILMTGIILVTLATNCEFVTQYQVYLNPRLIVQRGEFWRPVTALLYAGPGGFSTFFNVIFTYRYCRLLEETTFPRSSADFSFMILVLGILIVTGAAVFTEMIFLGQTFTHAILYIMCRRNPNQRVLIFGIVVLPADYVPLALMGLSLMTGHSLVSDIVAFAAGHLYFFLNDVFPKEKLGFRVLKTPYVLKILFNEVDSDGEMRRITPEDEVEEEVVEDTPPARVVDENNNPNNGVDHGVAPPVALEGEVDAFVDNFL